MKKKVIFIDKDGTLVKDIPYNINPRLVKLAPLVGESLKKLKQNGYQIFIISNQSGIARGYFREIDLLALWEKIQQLLNPFGVSISGFYYCPHLPEGVFKKYSKKCRCRKPGCGLLKRASTDHNIDLKKSWMLGDILNDIEAGKKAGCKTILIDTGNESQWKVNNLRMPDFITDGFKEATEIILSSDKTKIHHQASLKIYGRDL